MKSVNFKALPPLSLYIHIPWCIKKCPYCDFNSHNKGLGFSEDLYIDSLIKDIELALPDIWGRQVSSIFIGGGTPSLFTGKAIDNLLTKIRSLIELSPFAEITMEANPATVEIEFLQDYRKSGVNRLSLGIQSFNPRHLKLLGRLHSQEEAIKAIEIAKKYFDNINLDLMYGLPEQTLSDLEQDVMLAESFNCQHLSYYNLTIEPNTMFAKNIPINLPNEDDCYLMQEYIIDKLRVAGYLRYEVSAYAKNNYQAYHNLNYWLFGDYLGIGCGAHSKISFADKVIRQIRHKHPETYMQKVFNNKHIIENKLINTKDLAFEFMLNSLRLSDGFRTSLFTERTSLSLNNILEKIQQAEKRGLLKLERDKIIPTKKGFDFLNNLLINFLSDD
jgi:putative oxygen-independent coproporphyrinogen III oxidase